MLESARRYEDIREEIAHMHENKKKVFDQEKQLFDLHTKANDTARRTKVLEDLLRLRQEQHEQELLRRKVVEARREQKLSVSCGASSVNVQRAS